MQKLFSCTNNNFRHYENLTGIFKREINQEIYKYRKKDGWGLSNDQQPEVRKQWNECNESNKYFVITFLFEKKIILRNLVLRK